MEIRPFHFSDADYASYSEIRCAARPEYPITEDEYKEDDQRRESHRKFARFLAVEDGKIVGVAQYDQNPWVYHPDRYDLELFVLPEWQGRGYGNALYERLCAELASFDPQQLILHPHENEERFLQFAEERGFVETLRHLASWLFLADFPYGAFLTERLKVAEQGIVIKPLREREGDPDYQSKVWELESITSTDVPSSEPLTPQPFEIYSKFVFERSNYLPDGFFVALDEATGEYVGSSSVWKRQADNDLDQGLTAVRREYRRRGIALALKLQVTEWAKSQGFRAIRAENEVSNIGMLTVNRKLGFVPQPAQLEFTKRVRSEEES